MQRPVRVGVNTFGQSPGFGADTFGQSPGFGVNTFGQSPGFGADTVVFRENIRSHLNDSIILYSLSFSVGRWLKEDISFIPDDLIC